jgi:hypothetical protein|tara:strand:+ start:103 stop:963 length:861 start_codon:yes stop_codon:yes gene_type:complete
MAITQQQYYANDALWGGTQYTKLEDIINNFYAFYVGDGKIIDTAKRYDVVFHAKRALQELHYDALKEIRAVEIEVPPQLQMILPKDFVSLVRLSWIDTKGRFHPITENRDTAIGVAYLQNDDATYSYQFDAEGNIEVGSTISRERAKTVQPEDQDSTSLLDEMYGGRFGMITNKANINGTYNISKHLGTIEFSTELTDKLIMIEYVTDGLTDLDDSEIQVHKFAENYVFKQIAYSILSTKFGVQEYIVRRFQKEAFAALKNARIRLNDVNPVDLVKAMKGRNKWIK